MRSLFIGAADTPRNRDLEEEILQNTLDRYDDLITDGVSAESAYAQAVANIGNVESLLERPPVQYQPQTEPQKKSAGKSALIAAAVIIGILLLLLVGMLVLFGLNFTGHQSFDRYDDPGDVVENRFEAVEDRVEHWVEDVENTVEDTVEQAIDGGIAGFDYHYANADGFNVGTAEVETRNVNRLVIDWIAGSVTVEPYEGDTISISEPEQDKEKDRLRWRQEDDTLTVRYCASTGSGSVGAKELTVKIPKGLWSALKYVQISTVSADARVSGLEAGELQFDSTSGALSAEGSYFVLDLDTSSGNVEFAGMAKDVEMDTVSGDAVMDFSETPKALSFDSSSGDLALILPENRSIELDFETVSGDFHNEFGIFQNRDDEMVFEGTERGEPAELEVDTVSGDVKIEKAAS